MTAQGENILAWMDAAIAAREIAARAATGGLWEETGIGDYGWTVSAPSGAIVDTDDSDQGLADARHIAANDPESVLRRCAADRKLISQHGPCSDTDRGCKGCGFDNQEESMVDDYNSCPVLLALAEGYGWTGGER